MKYSLIVLILLNKVLHISCTNAESNYSAVNNVGKSTYSTRRDNEINYNKTIRDEVIVYGEKFKNNTKSIEKYIKTEIKIPSSNSYEVFEDLSKDTTEQNKIYRILKTENVVFETAESRYPRRSIYPESKSYQVTEPSVDTEFEDFHRLSVHSYKVSEDIDEGQDKFFIKNNFCFSTDLRWWGGEVGTNADYGKIMTMVTMVTTVIQDLAL
ncbi:hypothetical protein CBL_01537 [Carabus blaptoides fortunei]